MYTLACSSKVKLGSLVGASDREISREACSRVGGGDAARKSGAVEMQEESGFQCLQSHCQGQGQSL